MTEKKQGFIIEGTTCESCEKIVKRLAGKVIGVQKVTFDYVTETGYVWFDDTQTNIDEILSSIETNKQYTGFILEENDQKHNTELTSKHTESKRTNKNKRTNTHKQNTVTEQKGIHLSSTAWVVISVGILIAGYFLITLAQGISMPTISPEASYGLLFLIGLLTGLHCIGMCGAFVVGYTTKYKQEKKNTTKAHLQYAFGKTASYTIIGALFGLLGSIVAFTSFTRGMVGVFAGVFLVIYGLKMLNVFKKIRKIRIPIPKKIAQFIGKHSNRGPLIIGLLNGLMIACGPLQAMYILAAGTGSMIEGAKMLFIFGLGTLPALLGFGFLTSFISSKVTSRILKTSGAIVILLGIIMLNNGLALLGSGINTTNLLQSSDSTSNADANTIRLEDGYQIIEMDVTRYGWQPNSFTLVKDIPVKWIINGKEITGCNRAIQVPAYNLAFDINRGEQIIEFTPTETGTIRWTCWMGMIPGTFIVKDQI